jgi:nitroreductase
MSKVILAKTRGAMSEGLPFIVIDQSSVRDTVALAVAADRCRREGLHLLIPDGAGFEMSDVRQPFETWRNSLDPLLEYADILSVSRPISKMWAEELRTGRTIVTFVDTEGTQNLRALLKCLADGDLSSLRQLIDGPVSKLMPASSRVWSDSNEHKRWIKVIRDELRAMLSDETLNRLRRSPESEIAKWLSSIDAIKFVFQAIKSRDANDRKAFVLFSQPSILGAFMTSLTALAIYWLATGGLDSANARKLTNDLHDLEYAVLGCLSIGLQTEDRRLTAIYDAARQSQRERIAWCARALRVGPDLATQRA